MLILAIAVSWIMLRRFHYVLPYFLTIVWAFAGVLAAALQAWKDGKPIAMLALLALVCLFVSYYRSRSVLR